MKKVLIIFCLGTLFCACPKSIPEHKDISDEIEVYFPLKSGYAWHYLYTSLQDNTSSVIKTEVVGVENNEYKISSNNVIFYFIKDENGLKKKSAGYYILKKSIHKGEFWKYESGGFSGTITITEILPEIKVREKNFSNCIVVEEIINNQNALLKTYYASNVGPVLIEEYSTAGGKPLLISRTELLVYSFSKEETTE